jgi:hypothetical protein
MYGASLKPESPYSPISSIPSASCGVPPDGVMTRVCSSEAVVAMVVSLREMNRGRHEGRPRPGD